jgi:hypothetical protein
MQFGDAPAALAHLLKLPPRSALDLERAEQEIAAVEQRYNLRLPDDFRLHLMRMGPGEAEIWDDELVLWWPTGRLRNLPEEYPQGSANPEVVRETNRYIFFADYSIWCWAWAICCGNGENRGKVAVIGTSDDPFVANSFSDFATRYLRDPMSVM